MKRNITMQISKEKWRHLIRLPLLKERIPGLAEAEDWQIVSFTISNHDTEDSALFEKLNIPTPTMLISCRGAEPHRDSGLHCVMLTMLGNHVFYYKGKEQHWQPGTLARFYDGHIHSLLPVEPKKWPLWLGILWEYQTAKDSLKSYRNLVRQLR